MPFIPELFQFIVYFVGLLRLESTKQAVSVKTETDKATGYKEKQCSILGGPDSSIGYFIWGDKSFTTFKQSRDRVISSFVTDYNEVLFNHRFISKTFYINTFVASKQLQESFGHTVSVAGQYGRIHTSTYTTILNFWIGTKIRNHLEIMVFLTQ